MGNRDSKLRIGTEQFSPYRSRIRHPGSIIIRRKSRRDDRNVRPAMLTLHVVPGDYPGLRPLLM